MSGNEGALVNPLAAINQEAYDAEHHTAINLGIGGLTARCRELRTDLDAAVREAGDDFDVAAVTALKGDTDQATLGNIVDHHSRLSAAQAVLNQQRAIQAAVQRRAARDGRSEDDPVYDHLHAAAMPPTTVSLGDHVRRALHDGNYSGFRAAHAGNASFELDVDPRILAQMSRGAPGDEPNQWDSAASPPWSPETPRTVMVGRAALSMLDVIPSGTIGSAQHIYYREVSYRTDAALNSAKNDLASRDGSVAASAAAARSESAVLAQSAFQDIRVADTVESLGHRAKVTVEQLEDSARMQSMIDQRMPYGVRQAINRALLNGTGVSPQIKGFLAYKFDNSGSSDAAKLTNLQNSFSRVTVDASDNNTDAKAGKALMLAARNCQTRLLTEGDSMATAIVLHPESIEKIQLLETTSAGFYYGDPRVMPVNMLWGMPMIGDQYGLEPFTAATTASGDPTVALLGDFSAQAELLYRHGIRVEFGMSSDDFDRLVESVRAYVRAVLSVYRLRSFITIQVVA